MQSVLFITLQGFEFFSIGLLDSLKPTRDIKHQLMQEGSYWYFNSVLSNMKERDEELLVEYKTIRVNVE